MCWSSNWFLNVLELYVSGSQLQRDVQPKAEQGETLGGSSQWERTGPEDSEGLSCLAEFCQNSAQLRVLSLSLS